MAACRGPVQGQRGQHWLVGKLFSSLTEKILVIYGFYLREGQFELKVLTLEGQPRASGCPYMFQYVFSIKWATKLFFKDINLGKGKKGKWIRKSHER